MIDSKNIEIRDQDHLMCVEGLSYEEIDIDEIELYMLEKGWVIDGVDIFFDNSQKCWRFSADLIKRSAESLLK